MQIKFHINQRVQFGDSIYVAYNENGWSMTDSIRLCWNKGDQWIGYIETIKNMSEFRYKYVIADFYDPNKNVVWERGKNRKLSSKNNEFWEKRQVTLTLNPRKNDQLKNGSYILVHGSCKDLSSPKKMNQVKIKGSKRILYILFFNVSLDEIEQGIEYQYHILELDRFGSEITETISQSQKKVFYQKNKQLSKQ